MRNKIMKIMSLDHVGIRVMEFDRAIRFYEKLGFSVTRQDSKEHVVVLKHDSGVEINLLDSGSNDNNQKNVLMDVENKYPGYTHYALEVNSAVNAKQYLESIGLVVTEGPATFGDGKTSIFIRDPDKNVIELTQLP
ncbi:VOC family protein [Shewanella psychromarinicola]|uniref:VOC family protein n=1 Tax=Shewanella psychromarinicola TaxID=2487742 RepID=A0A3N4E301_9GAMM|nr:VOC family protein [Shewanella psychromarinicola]AZG34394.1 VOC family protein [Shewanella psychromarinicola]MCL1082055.1 VOC family protein [Shewanella psychromarinicola]RPA32493.1 VOC family protein [Shewanella psychromarinicola]